MTGLTIREAVYGDLPRLLELYTHLHESGIPAETPGLEAIWTGILADPNHHVIVGEADGSLVSSCVMSVIPNLTRGLRPYALVENVVTHGQYRRRGFALAVLEYAREIASGKGCYKIMLLTGSKSESVLGFYERAGYNRNDKTAFIQWI